MRISLSTCCLLTAGLLSSSLVACASNDAESTAEDTPVEQIAPPAQPSATTAALPDPCVLMASEEITAATDVGSTTGQPSSSGGAQVCTWTDGGGKSAVVQLYPDPSRFAASREAFPMLYGAEVEDVPGIGDRAFYIAGTTDALPTATVSAQKGDFVTIVQVMEANGDAAALQSAALELTQRFLQKL